MPPEFECDPERALWKPGRRSFLFMFGAALLAPSLPSRLSAESNTWTSGSLFLRKGDIFTIAGIYIPNTIELQRFMVSSESPNGSAFGLRPINAS